MKNFYDILKPDLEEIAEMTDARRQKEIEKAKKRISDFWDRAKGDESKFTAQVNLRTKKMTKIEKLQIWFDALEDENFHDEAEVAYRKLKSMKESASVQEEVSDLLYRARQKAMKLSDKKLKQRIWDTIGELILDLSLTEAALLTMTKKPVKDPGGIQFFVRVEKDGKIRNGYVVADNAGIIHQAFGRKGWIVTKIYEK